MIESPIRDSVPEDSAAATVYATDAEHDVGERWIWSYRHAQALAAEPSRLSWPRIVAFSLALALHLVMLLRMTVPPPTPLPALQDVPAGAAIGSRLPWDGLRVVFVEPKTTAAPPQVAADVVVAPVVPARAPQSPPRTSRVEVMPPRPPATANSTPGPPVSSPSAASEQAAMPSLEEADEAMLASRLFLADGAPVLPEAVVRDLNAVESDQRQFDYQVPGLAGAQSAFRRPSALEYTPTRFEKDWKPVRTLGGDLVVPVVEALTFENKRKTVRCSLLPPVCTWGKAEPGLELDDPETLSAAEQAQCQKLWESIVAATEQSTWLALRARFDAECRKPAEREDTPPAPKGAKAGSD